MSADARLDEAEHRYYLGDQEYPAVGRILGDMGLVDDFYKRLHPRYRIRGKAVHQACTYVQEGTYISAGTHAEIATYVRGYEKFVQDTGFKAVGMEEPLVSPRLRVAGKPDQWGMKDDESWVVDVKTAKNGDKPKGVEYQLGIYGALVKICKGFTADKRKVLVLCDGDYALFDCSQSHWMTDGLAAVRLWWQRVEWRNISWP